MAVTFPAMQHSFGRSPSSDVLLLALVAASAFVGLAYVRHRQRNARLPPGPKRGWLRSYDIPTKYQWLTYAKWKELYGAFPANARYGLKLTKRRVATVAYRRRDLHLHAGQSHYRPKFCGGHQRPF